MHIEMCEALLHTTLAWALGFHLVRTRLWWTYWKWSFFSQGQLWEGDRSYQRRWGGADNQRAVMALPTGPEIITGLHLHQANIGLSTKPTQCGCKDLLLTLMFSLFVCKTRGWHKVSSSQLCLPFNIQNITGRVCTEGKTFTQYKKTDAFPMELTLWSWTIFMLKCDHYSTDSDYFLSFFFKGKVFIYWKKFNLLFLWSESNHFFTFVPSKGLLLLLSTLQKSTIMHMYIREGGESKGSGRGRQKGEAYEKSLQSLGYENSWKPLWLHFVLQAQSFSQGLIFQL